MTVRTVILADFSDLLFTAQEIGYDWNEAHDFLVKDDILPQDGAGTIEHYLSDIDQYGYSEDTLKVFRAFFAEHKIDWVTLTTD